MSRDRVIRLALHEQPEPAVVSDRLPSLSGRDVCRALKEDGETSTTRVMMHHTGDTPNDVVRRGADASILQPLDSKLFVSDVRRLLAAG